MKPGDQVTYQDVNLRSYKGHIVSIGPTPHGGDCTVVWSQGCPYTGITEQCQSDLRLIKQSGKENARRIRIALRSLREAYDTICDVELEV